ncbi:MAG: hypothetical protein U1E65_26665 [Myxococcota bacterium]
MDTRIKPQPLPTPNVETQAPTEPQKPKEISFVAPEAPPTTPADRGRANAEVQPGATSFGPWSMFAQSAKSLAKAKSQGPVAIAHALRPITTDRTDLVIPDDKTRVEHLQALLGGLSADELDAVRSAYVDAYGADPAMHFHSWDLFQPIARLEEGVVRQMQRILDGPALRAVVDQLVDMFARAGQGPLNASDRATYFSELPLLGLWDQATRQTEGGPDLDALERSLLKEIWAEQRPGVPLDEALRGIEAQLPPPDLEVKTPRDRTIAVIASSHGAQWQELMDWMMVMHKEGYAVKVFTPEGRPVAFQYDSLCVNSHTTKLGFGAPLRLDPRGEAGEVARAALATTAPASAFDPGKFGAVYAAGGLGFNEDVAIATKQPDGEITLSPNKNIEKMIQAAVEERLPQISLCHGPTIYAAVSAKFGDKMEPISAGLDTSSLPPFEGYVQFTGRKGAQFNVDVDTHVEMHQAGGNANRLTMLGDIAHMSRVTKDEKYGLRLVTGPGPQAAFNLGAATVEELAKRWPKSTAGS